MGIISFETLADADPRRIEIVASRKFPFGDHIKESLLSLPPKVEMNIEATEGQRQGKPKLAVTLTRLTEARSNKRHYADMVIYQGWFSPFHFRITLSRFKIQLTERGIQLLKVVGLEEENVIIYHEKIR